MTYTAVGVQEFLSTTEPFNSLSFPVRERLHQILQPLRYRMGQSIIVRETMPSIIAILYSGQARLLGYPQGALAPTTLALLQPGSVLGWISTVRGIACETAIASSETICLTLPIPDFLELLKQHPQLKDTFSNQCYLVEVFDLLGLEMQRQAKGGTNLKELAINAHREATVLNLPTGKTPLHSLDPNLVWLLSGGTTNFNIGDRLLPTNERDYIKVSSSCSARIIGLRLHDVADTATTTAIVIPEATTLPIEIPYAPERPIPNTATTHQSVVF